MSNELRLLRQKAGLTLDELAAITNIHKSTLSRIETEIRPLRIAELPIFAKALNCSIYDLLGENDPTAQEVAP